jgi:high-affinity nickel-transport protein
MCLFDTADGCFMNFAYGWAFSRPVRKIYYNLVVTGLSVAVAFFIGTVELLGLLSSELGLRGEFWAATQTFNINKAGFVVVGLSVATWLLALLVWRWGDFDPHHRGLAVGEPTPAEPVAVLQPAEVD